MSFALRILRPPPSILILLVESQGELGRVEGEAHPSGHRGGAPSCGGGECSWRSSVPGVDDAIRLRRYTSSFEVVDRLQTRAACKLYTSNHETVTPSRLVCTGKQRHRELWTDPSPLAGYSSKLISSMCTEPCAAWHLSCSKWLEIPVPVGPGRTSTHRHRSSCRRPPLLDLNHFT